MHEPLQRASTNRRRTGALRATLAAAVYLCAVSPDPHAETSGAVDLSAVAPPRVPAPAGNTLVHDIAIETVAAGQEGVELSARLTNDGGLIQRPIDWTVISSAGETLFAGHSPIANAALTPGDYAVNIRYGAVNASQTVTLVPGTRLIVSFVLDAGGLRVLPRIVGVSQPATTAKTLIYALSGRHPGAMVATSELPGEVIRLPAGDYRVESRFAFGNADAVTDVRVKAGLMSAVEIDHKAGFAHLAYVGAADATVRWRITDAAGVALPPFDGPSADAVLKPGAYVATAQTGSATLTARFDIQAGQSRDIILGN